MSRVSALAEGPTDLDRTWGKRREYYELFMSDYNDSLARADAVLVELCRLRIAQLVESAFDNSLRYRPAQDAGLTEEKIAALSNYPESGLFSEQERVVLEYAEQFVIQSSSISDDDVARVQAQVTIEEFVYLTKALGVMDQFSRSNSAFRIEPPVAVPPTLPNFVLSTTN